MDIRIGHSADTHRLVEGRKLILGGVLIDYHQGLLGHSDADCLLHSITEAILGALGLGDMGKHFSDKDPKYKDMKSSYFLKEVNKMMKEKKYHINNIDSTLYLEEPHMSPYIEKIRDNIALILDIDKDIINIKATRGEGIGFIGRKEGITAETVLLLIK